MQDTILLQTNALLARWWPLLVAIPAAYILHVYRRARKTEPPADAGGSFWTELWTWVRLDIQDLVGLLGALAGGAIVTAKLSGFSLVGVATLDPVVLTNLGAIVLSGLSLSGVDLPPLAWGGILAGLLVVGLTIGSYWQNDNRREGTSKS